jgi:hypothetical protein
VKGCEGSSSLVKKEEVNQNSRSKDSSYTPEESREEARDNEAVELVFVDHESSPYLCEETSNQCPKYD